MSDGPGRGIQFKACQFDRGFGGEFLDAAAKHGLDAKDKLPRRERLGDVIVRAHFQAKDAVIFGSQGRNHDDRYAHALAESTTHFHTVQSWQHAVQNHKVRLSGCSEPKRREPIPGYVNLESGLQEIVADDISNGLLVFDEKDAAITRLCRR